MSQSAVSSSGANPKRLLLREQIGSMALRAVGVLASLLTNIVVAKGLTLEQIAFYYLYVTLAYFGNAGLYVGLDVVLQRLCATLASDGRLDKPFVVRYLVASLLCGGMVVLAFAGAYLLSNGAHSQLWLVAGCCSALSAATYLSTIGKDLLALSRRLNGAALVGMCEQLLRVGLVWVAVNHFAAGALQVAAASALALTVSGLAAIVFVLRASGSSVAPQHAPLSVVARTVIPVGVSGLLNWLQLQAYRPALLHFGVKAEILGVASLLTALGMTGANPAFVVTAQSYVPKIYAGETGAFERCIKMMLGVALALAVASIPAAYVFLLLSHRSGLMAYLLLVPLGVLVEAGNNFIGVQLHRQNANHGRIWVFPVAGLVGVLGVMLCWLISVPQSSLPYLIGLSMVGSQLLIIGLIRLFTKTSYVAVSNG